MKGRFCKQVGGNVRTVVGSPGLGLWSALVVSVILGNLQVADVRGQMTVPTQPAPTDTALALLSGPSSWPAPDGISVWPDSVMFGETITLILEFPTGDDGVVADSLICDTPWLLWESSLEPPAQGGGWLRSVRRWLVGIIHRPELPPDLPAVSGTRITRRARLLRSGPFTVGWDGAGSVLAQPGYVGSRLIGGNEPVSVRTPRSLGWRWPIIVTALLFLALLMGGMFWWRGRSRDVAGLAHTPIPPPAYLRAAQELWDLADSQLAARGEGKMFLDRLAAILRGYLVGRYGVRAEEMTSAEIRSDLLRRGYRPEQGEGFARLLQGADDRRYAPDQVPPEFCRSKLAQTVALIDTVKVDAQYTPVPADLAVSGMKCWRRLQEVVRREGETSTAHEGEEPGNV